MARHRFSRADGNFGGVSAEDLLNRAGLANIADVGRGCMGVDVINLAGRNTCMFERQLHSACRTFAVWWRRGHVIGVRRKSVAGKFTVYLGATRLRMFEFFHDQDSCAFAHDKTIAVAVERPGSPL